MHTIKYRYTLFSPLGVHITQHVIISSPLGISLLLFEANHWLQKAYSRFYTKQMENLANCLSSSFCFILLQTARVTLNTVHKCQEISARNFRGLWIIASLENPD